MAAFCSPQVLHLLLCQLSNRPLDPLLWQFLQLDERLVDIGDDLVDYEVCMWPAWQLYTCWPAADQECLG